VKASDIPNDDILMAIRKHMRPIGSSIWDIFSEFPSFPEKVIRAKLDKMVRRNVLGGCCCGCRGDFTIIGEDTPESEASKQRREVFNERLLMAREDSKS